MIINLSNVEEIVFMDKGLKSELPEFNHLFYQWKLSKLSPALRELGKRSLIDFLKNVQDEHIKIISNYLKTPVVIKELDYSITKTLKFRVDDCELELNNIKSKLERFQNFFTFRDKDYIYISFWR